MKKLFSTHYAHTSLDIGLLLFRVFIAITMIVNHAIPKFQKVIAGGDIQFADPLGIGTENSLYLALFAELFCSVLLLLGFLTRLALIPLIITMMVAAFITHSADSFSIMESSLVFLMSFILLFFTGPGKISLDNLFFNKEKIAVK